LAIFHSLRLLARFADRGALIEETEKTGRLNPPGG
jgi:hypothetical protein